MKPEMRLKLRGMIMENEGFKASIYTDINGHLTIGYGHNLDVRPISETVGDLMLDEDIQWFTAKLDSILPWFEKLDDARQCVVIDMAFNLGLKGFLSFNNLISYLSKSDYISASNEILKSVYARQIGDRAVRNAHIMKTGII